MRFALLGYRVPRGFPFNHINRAIINDFNVVQRLKYLSDYAGETNPLRDKTVLNSGVGKIIL